MRNLSFVLFFILIASGCAGPAKVDDAETYRGAMGMHPSSADRSAATAEIRSKLDALGTDEFLPVIIRLRDKADVRSEAAIQDATDKNALRSATASYLKAHAAESQKSLLSEIDALAHQLFTDEAAHMLVADLGDQARLQSEPGRAGGNVRGRAADIFVEGRHVLQPAADLLAIEIDR